ncbi:ABC transporter substrate-binding protein [Pusillimonas sp. CC-YST705]|uniref:ABC transporter substrate-binding protein n=1 Tax=Mesopusillimonas faecipullorum TaxID=2755040 RepID=A0ABS8C8X9_9BURK|nr:ABC transporter substrate-binding protein [Mesopusillimonas faecipullorum]MCB5362482.1 ABC transporter substrate-binding protein [Mesopusillimonas faecipullorum]
MNTWCTRVVRKLLGAAAVAVFMAGGAHAAPTELKIAYPVDLPSWDPTAVTFPAGQSLFKAVFDSPTFMDDKLVATPRQIESWKWLDDTGTKLELNLRKDIFFHDGSPLTAEDLKFTFERASKNKAIALNGMMPTVTGIEVVSPHQAVMTFSKPTPTAIKSLAFLTSYILPKAYIEKVGEEAFLKQPIGAGPYRLTGYQRGSRITLEAFDKYWGGKPAIDKVVFEIVPDSSARVAAVESGRVDVSVQIPVREVARLQKSPNLEAKTYPYSEMFILQMPSYVETFQNEHLRRAMQLAIDKQGISRAFYNNVAQPLSVLATKGSAADVPDFSIPFDREQAIAELAKAGYSKDKPVKMRLLSTNNTFPSDYDMARAIAQMWSQIGIETTVEEITMAKYLELSHSSKLDGVMLYVWANATGDPDLGVGRILDPRLRFSTWKDPALANELDALSTEMDEQKRLASYHEIMKRASDNAWSLPVLQSISTIAHKKGLNLPTYQTGYILPQDYSWK